MAALDGGFGRGCIRASDSNSVSDVLPISGSEVATAEAEPLVAVGFNEGEGFFMSPAGRREATGGGGGGRSGESERGGGLIAGSGSGGDGGGGGGGRGGERRGSHEKEKLGLGSRGRKKGWDWVEVVGVGGERG